ncbi:unnamed protein product [Lactuca saligna]|uniref:SWIM-type domain-containing protein n=1 Tax=Lactuca saligna TaxID=75948 RepID=A0AA35YJZ4_LACSI|nr:unnamed protein product [Lactuca saligna]
MASSPNPTDQNFIVVDFHYNGQFAPNPLVYFDPNRASVRDVDFSGFGYEQFMEFLHKLTNSRSKDIYFCLPQESLGLGIHTLVNNGDYKEFLDLAYANDKRMNVYVDHHNEPIFDWIEAEESESENEDLDEDEDSVIQDSYSVDHEEDDATYPFPANKTARDRFLNILCEPIESEDQDDEYVPPQYPVYDERQPWDQMKPIIVRGEVISAVGRDANNHIYPLAWAVVCVENKETWKWFIDLLMDDINGGLGAGITLLSDGHKGLLQAVKERCPEAEHRQCARHILANFNKRFTGQQYIKLFWRAVRASTVEKFRGVMENIKSIDTHAYDYLIDRDPTTWSKAFFKKEETVMQWRMGIYTQRVEGMEWDLLICPTIRKRIEHLKVKQRLWGVTPCGYQKYEVRFTDVAYGVDLIAKKCACRIWQLTGIPCLHGVAAISYLNHDAEAYVSQSYTTEAYLKCYKYSINPLNSSEMWPDVPYHKPLPPKRRRLPGRPSVKRKRDAIERELSGSSRQTVSRRGSIIKCGICKEPGHNKKKCPSNQQSNTSVPSSSRGSGADPSLSRGNEGPPPPPPPPAAQQPPPPPPAAQQSPPPPPAAQQPPPPPPAPMPRRRVPVSRSGRRKYSERIIKQALRRQIPGVGSNADNPSVID